MQIFWPGGDGCHVIYPRRVDELSAFIIASTVNTPGLALNHANYPVVYGFPDYPDTRPEGSPGEWVREIDYAAGLLGISGLDYLQFTWYEEEDLHEGYY